MRGVFSYLFLMVLVFVLFSCGKPKPKKNPVPPASTLYSKAEKDYQKGYLDQAYLEYKKLRDFYPASSLAVKALLKMADIKYLQGYYVQALTLYQEFTKFYPANPAVPYAIFQIGNCYYKLKLSYDRDPTYTKKAILTYKRLLEEFPGNPYESLVKKRIKKLTEILAKHELYVAKFYYKMGYYKAAYKRLCFLILNYPHTKYAKAGKKLLKEYYKKALIATKDLQTGKKKDFWGAPVP